MTPIGLKTYDLTPFETIDERDAVEKLAVEIPFRYEGHMTVVDELHVIDHAEHITRDDIGVVGSWHKQQRERYLIPLDGSAKIEVYASVGIEPETVERSQFGDVVAIVTTEDTFETDGMREVKDGMIMVNDIASHLIGQNMFSRCPTNGEMDVGCIEMVGTETVQPVEDERSSGGRMGQCRLQVERQMMVRFILIAHKGMGLKHHV